ncbi:MAG: hypothetical protein ACOC14_01070 [Bacillota bacterium]
MPNSRKVQLGILGLLITGFIFTLSSAFAYWRDVTVSNTVDVIVVREEAELVVDAMNEGLEDARLVPEGYRLFKSDVESITFAYNASLSRDLANPMNLHVTVRDITIGGESGYAHLVGIDILGQGTRATTDLFNDHETVTVVVTLIEPIDAIEAAERGFPEERVNVEDSKAAYENIKGETIAFTLDFSLTAEEESINEN